MHFKSLHFHSFHSFKSQPYGPTRRPDPMSRRDGPSVPPISRLQRRWRWQ